MKAISWLLRVGVCVSTFFCIVCAGVAQEKGGKPALEPVSRLWMGFGVPGGSIQIRGKYLFMAPGEGDLAVYDVSDPRRPHIVAHRGVGFVSGFSFLDDRTFWIGPRGRDSELRFTTDPPALEATPLTLKLGPHSESPPDIRQLVPLSGGKHMLAVTPYSERCVYTLAATGPTSFKEIGSLEIPGRRTWGGTLHKRRFYVSLFEQESPWKIIPHGIGVVDLSDLKQPRLVAVIGDTDDAFQAANPAPVDDNHLLVDVLGTDKPTIALLDIQNPAKPRITGQLSFDGYRLINSKLCRDKEIFLTLAQNKGTQDEVSRKTENGKVTQTSAFARVIIGADGGLTLAELVPGEGIRRYRSIAVDKGKVYISDYNFGLWIFARDKNGQWQQVGACPAPAESHFVAVSGNLAVVTPTFASLAHMVDVSNPAAPRKVGWFWNQEWVYDSPALVAGALYLPGRYGITIADVRQPRKPKRVGELPWPSAVDKKGKPVEDMCFRILARKRHAVAIASRDDGWRVRRPVLVGFDLSDPLQPAQRWSLVLEDHNCVRFTPTLAVDGKRLYVNDVDGGRLDVFEGWTGEQVKRLGSFPLEGVETSRAFNVTYPGKFAVGGGWVYLLNGGEVKADHPILHVIDFRDPAKPRLVRSIMWKKPSYFVDIALYQGRLYVLDYWGVIEVFDVTSNPAKPARFGQARAPWASWSIGVARGDLWLIPSLSELGLYKIRP